MKLLTLSTERPKNYANSFTSKSERSVRRHKKHLQNQPQLTSFFSKSADKPIQACPGPVNAPACTPLPPERQLTLLDLQPEWATFPSSSMIPQTRSASMLSDPVASDHEDMVDEPDLAGSPNITNVDAEIAGSVDGSNSEEAREETDGDGDEMTECWEDELMLSVGGDVVKVRDWTELRQKIKSGLKKNGKSLSLTHVNQLTILSNFATLRIKGYSRTQASIEIARQWHEGEGVYFARRVRALARHFQVFEQLPIEKQGGKRSTNSWLHDEAVQTRTRAWLTAQKVGEVTPRKLQQAVTSTIFPDLNIMPKKPLSKRTARRWLIKLGWRHTTVRKGVYMDGHERDDVVKYRKEVFLPLMAQYESRMTCYEGPELKKVEPVLKSGEKRIIAQFHDECCFHANDQRNTAWFVSESI